MLCIELYEHEACDVHDGLPPSINATLQSVALRFWERCRVYAEDGTVWQPQPTGLPRLSFVRRVLVAVGFWNPPCPIAMSYAQVGRYTLADLKVKLQDAVRGMYGEVRVADETKMKDHVAQVMHAETFGEIARIVHSVCITTRPPGVDRSA